MLQRAKEDDGEGPPFRATPFSGGERNRMFLNRDGNYSDVTLVSGADYREDGRGFALLDFDNDGFLDMAVVSPNVPRLRLVRNGFADQAGPVERARGDTDEAMADTNSQPARETTHRSLRIRLTGGQTGAEPSSEWSSREPYGAMIHVTMGGSTRVFQLACGEGLSSQNSRLIHVGMGTAAQVDRVTVHWPSGRTTERSNVEPGILSIFENPQMDPDNTVE